MKRSEHYYTIVVTDNPYNTKINPKLVSLLYVKREHGKDSITTNDRYFVSSVELQATKFIMFVDESTQNEIQTSEHTITIPRKLINRLVYKFNDKEEILIEK